MHRGDWAGYAVVVRLANREPPAPDVPKKVAAVPAGGTFAGALPPGVTLTFE